MSESLKWPSKEEYDLAMKDWVKNLQVPDLRNGQVARDQFGFIRPGGANRYVVLYLIDQWLVRCFCSTPLSKPPDDIIERYQAIETFCKINARSVPALIEIKLHPNALRVGSRLVDIVTMPYIKQKTQTLGDFIDDNYNDKTIMQQLSDAWLNMISTMETVHMAHGDLDLSNVLVQNQGGQLTLRLVDYDNMYVPVLKGRRQTEIGHEPFQHPKVLPPYQRAFDEFMDRFSALSIYISLLAITEDATLFDDFSVDAESKLLLDQLDYADPTRSDGKIAKLRARVPTLEPYLKALVDSLQAGSLPPSITLLGRSPYSPMFLKEQDPFKLPPTVISMPGHLPGPVIPIPGGNTIIFAKNTTQNTDLLTNSTPLPTPPIVPSSPHPIQKIPVNSQLPFLPTNKERLRYIVIALIILAVILSVIIGLLVSSHTSAGVVFSAPLTNYGSNWEASQICSIANLE